MGERVELFIGDRVRVVGLDSSTDPDDGVCGVVQSIEGHPHKSFLYEVMLNKEDGLAGGNQKSRQFHAAHLEIMAHDDLGDFKRGGPSAIDPHCSIILPPPYEVPEGVVTMTRERLRDEFAMAALQSTAQSWGSPHADECARRCYEFADAMLDARESGA